MLAATHGHGSPPRAPSQVLAAASQVGEDAGALFVGWGSPGLAQGRAGYTPFCKIPKEPPHLASLQLPVSSCPKLVLAFDLKLVLCSVLEALQLALL